MVLVSKNIKYAGIRVDALRIGRQRIFRTRRPECR